MNPVDAAIQYAEMGYRIFPCAPGEKYPATANGFHDATGDIAQIRSWWEMDPSYNPAVETSGLLVVDVDGAENTWPGNAARAQDLTGGCVSVTPRGGRHYIFRDRTGRGNTTGKLAARVDTRATGGYILVPPSIVGGRRYQWAPGMELCPRNELIDAPEWIITELDAEHVERQLTGAENPIPEGQRNHTLASIAGTMRRIGMSEQEIHAALVRVNENRCRPPLMAHEVMRIASSIASYEPDQISVAVVENHWEQLAEDTSIYRPIPAPELILDNPSLAEPLIHGILRQGETMNVVAQSKMGKSWLTLQLATSIAQGSDWLGYPCRAGKVLIVDNELHAGTSANRLKKVFKSLEIRNQSIAERIHVINLRGKLLDLAGFLNVFRSFEDRYSAVILDAFYRFLPNDISENDNAAMANLYNLLDHSAQESGASFIVIHHSSKGAQSGKIVTDVGSGAGAQSRAADTHLVLRRHQEADVVVLDAAVRSWPPVSARCLRWTFPVWSLADELDPDQLDDPVRSRQEQKQDMQDRDAIRTILDVMRSQDLPITKKEIRIETGFSNARCNRILCTMIDKKFIRKAGKRENRNGLPADVFSIIENPELRGTP